MAEAWYVQDAAGTVSGPFSEKEVAEALLSGQITDPMRLRQSNSDWCEASRVRSIFRQLFENGWYIRQNDHTHGPFTDAKLRELCEAGEVKPAAEIRRGTVGPWRLLAQTVALTQQAERPPPNMGSVNEDMTEYGIQKWSTEPIRHIFLPLSGTEDTNPDGSQRSAIVGRCQPHERLLLKQPAPWREEDVLLRVTRTNGEQLGCLSARDTRQILEQAERGVTYVVLLDPVQPAEVAPELPRVRVALVVCPPGTRSENSVHYIERTLTRRGIGLDP